MVYIPQENQMTIPASELAKIHSLLNIGPVDIQRKCNIWTSLIQSTHVIGDVIEMGSFQGATTALLRFLMNSCCPNKKLHIYDGFQGLHGRCSLDGEDASFENGTFCSTPEQILDTFAAYTLEPPIIHKSLIEDLTPEDLPERISFAFLDLDLYEPTKYALELVWPRLSNGAFLIIDDYRYHPTPGIERAVEEFFFQKDVNIRTPAPITAQVRKWIRSGKIQETWMTGTSIGPKMPSRQT